MASESTDESVSLSLPPELAEWVDRQAAERDSDPETVLVQLVAAHRATTVLDDDAVGDVTVTADLEAEVRDVVAERLPDIADAVGDSLDLGETVEEVVAAQVEDAVAAHLDEVVQSAADEAAANLEGRIAAVEDDFGTKLEDVRERVVQVKRETDAKAPADHDHPDLADRVDDLAETVADLDGELADLAETVEDRLDSQAADVEELAESLSDAEERLQTIAYVVRDLRDRTEADSKRATSVDGIKQRAAELDLDRAACEACGEGVEIALMTDPECPHCQAAVTDVEPKQGFLGKPHLVTAHGIEAPEDE